LVIVIKTVRRMSKSRARKKPKTIQTLHRFTIIQKTTNCYRVCDYCLTLTQQLFIYIMARAS
jgi:2-iminoacetate synthase ThiH